MTHPKRIARFMILLAPLALTACNCEVTNTCANLEPWLQQLIAGLNAQSTSQTASTLSQDTNSLVTDPWWGGNPVASPMAPSN